MGKYIMGVFFLLIAVLLVVALQVNTVPDVEDVGEKVDSEIPQVYKDPNASWGGSGS